MREKREDKNGGEGRGDRGEEERVEGFVFSASVFLSCLLHFSFFKKLKMEE